MIFRSYTEGDSLLHRINPAIKLAAFSLLLIAPTLFLDPVTPACFLLVPLILAAALGGRFLIRLLRGMGIFFLLSIGLLTFNTLFYGGQKVHLLARLGPLTVYREGVLFGLSIALRLLCVTAYSTVFVATTDPVLLVSSLIRQVRLPYRIAYAVLAAYRFLPILQRELSQIRDAHRIRGGFREGIRDRLYRIRRYAIPLLSGGIRQAERMSISMDARGFSRPGKRTCYRTAETEAKDFLFLAAAVFITAAIPLILARCGLARGFLAGVAESVVGR